MNRYSFTEKKDTRSGFGAGLMLAAKEMPQVVALAADLTGSVKMDAFAKAYPERFFQVGIAEANMISIAAGMAVAGKIPFTGTFAEFATGRVYDQIRQSVAYSQANVKIYAPHSGLTVGEDGATHQALEDMGMIRMMPGMTVVHPCDYNQAVQATLAVARYKGPVYLRCGRPAVPNFTPADQVFEIGKGYVLQEGSDLTIIAIGHLVWPALEAAAALEEKGIHAEVINMPTLKPLDTACVLASVRKTGRVLTCEEHQLNGGLGDAVANFLVRNYPVPMEMVGVDDRFGQSGTPQDLLDHYGLNVPGIVAKAEALLARK
ncbi:MAG: transketolase family protein [Bacteroidetes bacterium]|uniref:Transketolase family protein n=1 Tax=Candidatus Pullibacteroides excrementavium TaxID=2840905 RepID=A0A9D9DSP0_9BACT|nr:transketolase family protein [Candidatus Pullibacteroides excrementavium]